MDDTTATPATTTEPVTAPATTTTTATTEPAAEQSTSTPAPTVANTDAAPAAEQSTEDHSWVPKKFFVDGKPDMKRLAESYQALEKKIHSKAGVAPESIDDYVYEPKHYQATPEESTAFKEVAQKLSLSPSQYAGLQEFYDDYAGRTMYTPERAKAYLEEKWGGDMNRNAQHALKAWDTFGPSGVSMDTVGNIPEFIEFMANVGADLGEDSISSKSTAPSNKMSRDDVRALIQQKDAMPPNSKERNALDAQIQEWYTKNIK